MTAAKVFSCEFCVIFVSSFFNEHVQCLPLEIVSFRDTGFIVASVNRLSLNSLDNILFPHIFNWMHFQPSSSRRVSLKVRNRLSNHSENNFKAPPALWMQINFFLKFELQYNWTPPQLFFCWYRVLELFCHNVEEAHDIKCSFARFIRTFLTEHLWVTVSI